MLNNAVMVAPRPREPFVGAVARAALDALQAVVRTRWNATWAMAGPQAVTSAFVRGAISPDLVHLYAAETFGFVTCDPTRPAGGGGGSDCIDYSRPPPIDAPGATEAQYRRYLRGRMAQHGVKKPPGLPAPPGSGGTVRERIFRERCPEVYDGLQKS